MSEGWFVLEYGCFYPKNQPRNGFFDLGNVGHTIHLLDGHRYTLQCDPDVFGKADLIDITSGQTLL